MTLKIMHAPLKGPAARAKHQRLGMITKSGVDSVGLTEAHLITKWWLSRGKWRHTPAMAEKSRARRGWTEVPILTRKTRPNRGMGTVQASNAVKDNLAYAPARFLSFSLFKHPFGQIAHIAVHPNANVRGRLSSAEAKQYAASMKVLEEYIELFRALGFHCIVTGDLNFTEPDNQPLWAPAKVFRRTNLAWWREGIDWIAYDERLYLKKKRLIRASVNGGDHPWMIATFDKEGIK